VSRAVRRFKIPSRSEPNTFRWVTEHADGTLTCDCPARVQQCFHVRKVRTWKGEVKGSPEECWYTQDNRRLEQHHLYRGPDRPYSLTIFITRWVHNLATYNHDFAAHLQNLYFHQPNPMQDIRFNAKVKEVSIRNLESPDKSVQVILHSQNITEAMKLAALPKEQLIRVLYEEGGRLEFWALVSSVKKENLKQHDDRATIVLSAAPREAVTAAGFGLLPWDAEVTVEHKTIT